LLTTPQAKVHVLPPTGPVQVISEPPPVTATKGRAVHVGTATQKLARDAAQIKALCAATGNAPAGFPAGVCKTEGATHP